MIESLNGSWVHKHGNWSQFDGCIIKIKLKMLSYIAFFRSIVFFIYLQRLLGNLILILSVICSKQLHTPTFVAICSMTITDSNGCLISLIILLVGKMTFITKICCLFHIESPLLRLLSLHVMQCFCFPFSTLWPFICWSATNISPIRLSSVHHKKYFEDTVLFFFFLLHLIQSRIYNSDISSIEFYPIV